MVERVWAALQWASADAGAAWSGRLTPQSAQGDFLTSAALAEQVGRLFGLRLLAADDPVNGQLVLVHYHPPLRLRRQGAVVRTAMLEVSGQSPLPRPLAAESQP